MRRKVARAVDLLGSLKGASCLDVCTGTGLVAWEMARRGAQVTAVDFSAAMLRTLREAARVARRHVLVVDYAGRPANPLARVFCAVAEWLEGGWYGDFLRGDLEGLFARCGLEVLAQDQSDFVGIWLTVPRGGDHCGSEGGFVDCPGRLRYNSLGNADAAGLTWWRMR